MQDSPGLIAIASLEERVMGTPTESEAKLILLIQRWKGPGSVTVPNQRVPGQSTAVVLPRSSKPPVVVPKKSFDYFFWVVLPIVGALVIWQWVLIFGIICNFLASGLCLFDAACRFAHWISSVFYHSIVYACNHGPGDLVKLVASPWMLVVALVAIDVLDVMWLIVEDKSTKRSILAIALGTCFGVTCLATWNQHSIMQGVNMGICGREECASENITLGIAMMYMGNPNPGSFLKSKFGIPDPRPDLVPLCPKQVYEGCKCSSSLLNGTVDVRAECSNYCRGHMYVISNYNAWNLKRNQEAGDFAHFLWMIAITMYGVQWFWAVLSYTTKTNRFLMGPVFLCCLGLAAVFWFAVMVFQFYDENWKTITLLRVFQVIISVMYEGNLIPARFVNGVLGFFGQEWVELLKESDSIDKLYWLREFVIRVSPFENKEIVSDGINALLSVGSSWLSLICVKSFLMRAGTYSFPRGLHAFLKMLWEIVGMYLKCCVDKKVDQEIIDYIDVLMHGPLMLMIFRMLPHIMRLLALFFLEGSLASAYTYVGISLIIGFLVYIVLLWQPWALFQERPLACGFVLMNLVVLLSTNMVVRVAMAEEEGKVFRDSLHETLKKLTNPDDQRIFCSESTAQSLLSETISYVLKLFSPWM